MDNVATDQEAEIAETPNPEHEYRIGILANRFEIVLNSYNSEIREKSYSWIPTVPLKLRKVNDAAYNPQVVVIGHLCHHEPFLESLESSKQIFLCSFLKRAEQKADLKAFLRLIESSRARIQGCYAVIHYRLCPSVSDVWEREDNLSTLMILMDATFIIELFLKEYYKECRDDAILCKPGLIRDIQRDLILLENQLPFFFLSQVYDLAFAGNPNFPSFLHLTCQFFSFYYNQNISIQDILSPNSLHGEYRSKLEGAKHFTDLLRTFQLPHSFKTLGNDEEGQFRWKSEAKHLEGEQGEYLYSAVLLREAGVKFKVSSRRCLLEIEFNEKNGELRIPAFRVDELTESFYRNLMAWEQWYYPRETYICDYIFLMEYLIKSVEDVDLLVRRRIMINQLGSHNAVVTLFNELCKNIIVEKNHYSGLFKKLNAYNAIRHHSWIAILKLQYFSTLWRGVATIVAVVLLLLTLIQTICSVISL
ncbi:hypothetical protein REPUB_Repub11eG0001100 [Reevesia pubescens]